MAMRIFMSIGLLVLFAVLVIGQLAFEKLELASQTQLIQTTQKGLALSHLYLENTFAEIERALIDGPIKSNATGKKTMKVVDVNFLRQKDGTEITISNCSSFDIETLRTNLTKQWKQHQKYYFIPSRLSNNQAPCLTIAYVDPLVSINSQSIRFIAVPETTMLNIFNQDNIAVYQIMTPSGLRIWRPKLSPLEWVQYELPPRKLKQALVQAASAGKVTAESRDLTQKRMTAVLTKLRPLGGLILMASLKPNQFSMDLEGSKRDLILWMVALMLLSMLMALTIAAAFTKPIETISRATNEIANGNFDVKVQVTGVNELQSLGRSVNDLAYKIQNLMHQQRDLGRLNAEIETAQLVQKTLFPAKHLHVKNAIQCSSYAATASECGGDIWGAFALPNDRACIYIGDASGHGVPSAFITIAAHAATALMQSMIHRSATNIHWGPNEILQNLNTVISAVGNGQVLMTMFVAVVDPHSKILEFANAGHMIPWLRTQNPQASPTQHDDKFLCTALASSGSPLGFNSDYADWSVSQRPFNSGDNLILYTDGLLENAQHLAGRLTKRHIIDALQSLNVSSPNALCDVIQRQYELTIAQVVPKDDCTIVVASLNAVASLNNAA
jgi:serine phosphatase RsbU (regulator of sigma subunit)